MSWFASIPAEESASTNVSGTEVQVLDAEQIRKFVDQAKQEKTLDEVTRSQIQTLYSQALEQLELAQQWKTKSAEFESLRIKSPDLLRSLTDQLSRPAEQPGMLTQPAQDLALLTQQLNQAEQQLESAEQELLVLKEEKSRRNERRLALPNLLSDARDRLNDQASKSTPETTGLPMALLRAQQILRTVRRSAIQNEISAYQEELLSYDTRGDLLQTRTELADREVGLTREIVSALSLALDERRGMATRAAMQEAELQVAQTHPALRTIAPAKFGIDTQPGGAEPGH